MALPRLDYPGARHHVMNRGARRAPIFVDRASRQLFLDILAELPRRFGVRVHAYALMPNHYHLLLESVRGQLSRAMRHLGGEYSRRLNFLHAWDGPLFRGRFRNRLVETDAYWHHLLLYVHANPARAGVTGEAGRWTSHAFYSGRASAPEWLETRELLTAYGSSEGYRGAFEDVLSGVRRTPDGFDADRLWSPQPTNTVDVPDVMAPAATFGEALAQVARVTEVPVDRILQTSMGRRGNRAQWLAVWWASQLGVDHGTIARSLGTTHSGVSRRIRTAKERRSDPDFTAWLQALGWSRAYEASHGRV